MKRESLVSITDFSKEEILDLLEKARRFEENPNRKILEGKVVATLFFEPSTRTRLSFETAVNRLGGKVIGFSDASTTSSSKGETLKDTIMMVSNYVDLIIMRHHLEGAAVMPLKFLPFPLSMQETVQISTPRKPCSIYIPSTRHKAPYRT